MGVDEYPQPPEEFSYTVELAAEPDLDSRFSFALDRLLDGVEALSGRREPRS